MITKIKDGRYKIDLHGGHKMEALLFDPGPWFSGSCNKRVKFQTNPEVLWWWGIDCKDFLGMAWLTICALIRDKYWEIKRWVKCMITEIA